MENQEQVIAQMCSGDSGAFDILFRHYQTSVYRTAYALVGNRETAGEILQDVFIAVWKYRRTFNPKKGAFSTWLHRITVNRCEKTMKRLGKHSCLSIEDLESRGIQIETEARNSLEQTIIHNDEYHRLIEAVNQLSPKLKTVVVLRFFNELSYEEIASVACIPVGTVKSRLNAAINQISKMFSEEGNL
ncbi:MAG: RNA polymerase sigma factor [Dehalococcoidales bacterium]|nr:RNA polymerase sigma factor [Dehalococcoidales bacterium]